jgi:hypothetical protein
MSAAGTESRAVGTDLPPGSSRGGTDKGAVTLRLGQLAWQLRGAPPWCKVTVRWWGDAGANKKRRPWVRLDGGEEGGAEMTFPVNCKPAGFSRYCRDARAVVLEVRHRPGGRGGGRVGGWEKELRSISPFYFKTLEKSESQPRNAPPQPPSPHRACTTRRTRCVVVLWRL